MAIQTHIDACLLAVASSTDNFMVGISAGLISAAASSSSSPSPHASRNFYKVNVVVALCNASGTLLATYGGGSLASLPEKALQRLAAVVTTSSSPETYILNIKPASMLAALAFAYLAWKEYVESSSGDVTNNANDAGDDDKAKKAARNSGGLSYSMALPMTLNNLAGGVAGGVLGLSVWQATFYAFVVSFGSMALGYYLARRLVQSTHQSALGAPRWCQHVAISIYVLLCLQSLWDV